MSSLFNSALLLESGNTETNRLNYVSLDESYFVSALSAITECNADLHDSKRTFVKHILEANGDNVLIQEAFSGFVDLIKRVVDKFLAFIKRIVARFITTLNRIVKSDKYLVSHKKDFDKYSDAKKFDMSVYKFTFIDDDTFPKTEVYNIYKTVEGDKYKETDNLVEHLKKIRVALKDSLQDKADTFRGLVIGAGSMGASDYDKSLFEKFRNGESSASSEEVTSEMVRESYARFEGYDKAVKRVNNLKTELEKNYNEIKKNYKNTTKFLESGDVLGDIYNMSNLASAYNTASKEVDAEFSLFIFAKIDQLVDMSSIHGLAFAAKLDAIKDAYVQDKKLLYGALSRIVKTKGVKEDAQIPEYLDTMSETSTYVDISGGDDNE